MSGSSPITVLVEAVDVVVLGASEVVVDGRVVVELVVVVGGMVGVVSAGAAAHPATMTSIRR
jgi:hypothetical protein